MKSGGFICQKYRPMSAFAAEAYIGQKFSLSLNSMYIKGWIYVMI